MLRLWDESQLTLVYRELLNNASRSARRKRHFGQTPARPSDQVRSRLHPVECELPPNLIAAGLFRAAGIRMESQDPADLIQKLFWLFPLTLNHARFIPEPRKSLPGITDLAASIR